MKHNKNLLDHLTALENAYRRGRPLHAASAWTGDVVARAEQEVRRLTRELGAALATLRKAVGAAPATGRPRKLVDAFEVHKLREAGVSVAAIARQLEVSRYTVYRALKAGAPAEPDSL